MPVITPETLSLLTPHVIDLFKGVLKSRKDQEAQGASQEQAIDLLNKGVLELQEVANNHGAAITEIAGKVEERLTGLERQLRRQQLISIVAIVVAAVAVAVAVVR